MTDDIRVLIMAGGKGRRLLPLTVTTPKPMLYLGDKPLLEHAVDWVKSQGFHTITLALCYQSQSVRQHFPEIDCVIEDEPLGTAGALGLLDPEKHGERRVLVLNGDIVTNVPLTHLVDVMEQSGCAVVVGTRDYGVELPYGVVDISDDRVTSIREKPRLTFHLTAGIYLIDQQQVSVGGIRSPLDMPDLIADVAVAGLDVRHCPIRGYWMDIGEHHRYLQADKDVREGRVW